MYCPLLQKPQFLIFFSFIWLALTSLDQPLVMLNDGKEDAERAAGANDVVSLLFPEIVETVILPEPIAITRLFLATLAAGFVPVLLPMRSSLGAIIRKPARTVVARLFLATLAAGFVPGLFASGFDQLESGQ